MGAVGPQHVVIHYQMVEPKVFRRLGPVPYGYRVAPYLGLGKDSSDFHSFLLKRL